MNDTNRRSGIANVFTIPITIINVQLMVWTQASCHKYGLCISMFSMNGRVSEVLRKTVAGDTEWRFDNLGGNHAQNQSVLCIIIYWPIRLTTRNGIPSTDDSPFTWLRWWLPHRLLKRRQPLSPITALFRTTITRTIILNLLGNKIQNLNFPVWNRVFVVFVIQNENNVASVTRSIKIISYCCNVTSKRCSLIAVW